MIQQVLYEVISQLLSVAAGIYAYPYMTKFIRLLFFQLIAWQAVYLSSHAYTAYQHSIGLEMQNHWIYNIQVPLELLFLTVAACYFLKDALSRHLAIILYIIFLLTVALQLKLSGTDHFINYGMVVAGIIVTILYSQVLYRKFNSDHLSWKRSPEIWASTGLIIYFACNIPYFSMFDYLNVKHPALSEKLFHFITDVLANIRYLFLAIAFLLVRKNKSVLYRNAS